MKIICLLSNLQESLNKLERVASVKNNSLPILNNIYISAKKTGIIFKATDLEMAITVSLPGKVEREGSVTAPIKILSAYLSNVVSEKISMEQKEGELLVEFSGGEAKIKTIAAGEFPIVPEIKDQIVLNIPAEKLKAGLTKVSPSVMQSDTRPEISGVFFKLSSNILYLVGTDSFRLAEDKINVSDAGDFSFILPLKTVSEIVRLLDMKNSNNIEISLEKNQVSFKSESFTLISRIIDGNFPKYNQIIPDKFKTTVILPKIKILQIIKSNSLFSSRRNDIDINFDFEKKELSMKSVNNDVGESFFTVGNINIEGESIASRFNYKYLLDGLNCISTDNFIMKFSQDKTNISKLVMMDEKDANFQYIVMPMNIL